MGELLTKAFPKILLVGALGVAGCGGALRGRAVPDLDCGANPKNTNTTTFGGMKPGDTVKLGHTFVTNEGRIESDIKVSLRPNGSLVGTANDRNESTGALPEIQAGLNGGLQVTAGDESYAIQAQALGGDLYTVTVAGRCIDTA